MTQDKMTHDTYKKLLYFYENKLDIHFKDFAGVWYNGSIEDLNEEKLTLVLNERVKGMMPILLEHIDNNSIRLFKFKGLGEI